MPVAGLAGEVPARTPAPGGAGPEAVPRRERKKQQTRDALIAAALQLFAAKGYEHTAIREITDAVDVSERTFFRYFESKDDLVLSFVRDASDMVLEALAARPREEAPLAALRGAFRDALGRLTADGGILGRRPAYVSIMKLIESSPALLAAELRFRHENESELVRLLAEREGVDPAADPRPRVLAAVFDALATTASRDLKREGGSIEAMLAAFDGYADQLSAAISGHWRP